MTSPREDWKRGAERDVNEAERHGVEEGMTQVWPAPSRGAEAVLAALVAYGRWTGDPTRENAVALRDALTAISLHGPLASSLRGICQRAEAALSPATQEPSR